MRKNKLTVIDLFCGCGGLSLGLENVGFDLLYANDIDKHSINTFKRNRSNIKDEGIVCGDIKIFLKKYKNKLKNLNSEIVAGGPPCQGFSMANRQRIINDPRNELYKEFINTVSLVKPFIVLMENVKGMLKVADQVVEDFKSIGYTTDYKLLNAKDFGIPQNRERVFYLGASISKYSEADSIVKAIFDEIESNKIKDRVLLRDIFWGLRKLTPKTEKNNTKQESGKFGFLKDKYILKYNAGNFDYVYKINRGKLPKHIFNHKSRFINERDREIYRLLPIGGKSDHPSIEKIMPYKNRNHIFKDKFYKLKPDEISKTITSHMKFDCHMYIHPYEARAITPREAARIQSFPDDYEFTGPYTQWYNQIGNAVPPLLAKIIGKSILTVIRHDR